MGDKNESVVRMLVNTELSEYSVQVFVDHGIYEYDVSSAEQALAHCQAIVSSGVYRRCCAAGVEFYPVNKVKAIGPGLESQYKDRFIRT